MLHPVLAYPARCCPNVEGGGCPSFFVCVCVCVCDAQSLNKLKAFALKHHVYSSVRTAAMFDDPLLAAFPPSQHDSKTMSVALCVCVCVCVCVYVCGEDAILKRKACMGPGVGAQRCVRVWGRTIVQRAKAD